MLYRLHGHMHNRPGDISTTSNLTKTIRGQLYSLKAVNIGKVFKTIIGTDTATSGSYPSSNLLGKGLHQVVNAVVHHYGVVEDKLLIAVNLLLNVESLRHQWVPVIQGVEL